MAEGKKSFVAYSDWRDTFDQLPDEEAGKLIKHIFAYVNDEEPKSESVLINAVFAQIKNTLKRDLNTWDKQIEQRSAAGKKSGERRAAKSNDRSTAVDERALNSTDSLSDSVSDSVRDSDKKDKPSLKAFIEHAISRRSDVCVKSVEQRYWKWIDNNWCVNRRGVKTEIKNWKLTLTNTLPYLDVDPAKYQEQSTPLTEQEEIKRVRTKGRRNL